MGVSIHAGVPPSLTTLPPRVFLSMVVFSIPKQSQELFENLQRVAGPVHELNHFDEPGSWRLRLRYLERDFSILVHTNKRVLDGLSFGTLLGNRPITLTIHDTRTTMIGMPVVQTLDPAFDGQFVVNGWPESVIQELLDEPTRRWLVERHSGADPRIRTDAGFLMLYEPLSVRDELLARPRGRVPTPEQLASWLQHAIMLADRAAVVFDGVQAAIQAAEGPDAAAQWVQRNVDGMQARAERRSSLRMILIIVVALVVLLPIIAIVLFMFSALMCSGTTITIG